MVSDEEMLLKGYLERQAGSPTDLAELMKLAPKYQGTNMESYPDRFIPPHAKMYMGNPNVMGKTWLRSGVLEPGTLDVLKEQDVNGVVRKGRPEAFVKPTSEAQFTLPHELEHTSQWIPPIREGWGQIGSLYNRAMSMTETIDSKLGYATPNSGELMAHLSSLEALAPPGESWKERLPWNTPITDAEFQKLDSRRRPDLREPLKPLPKPNVKQYGYTGAGPSALDKIKALIGRWM